MANLRRPHGLGKNPERAQTRAAQLTAIDADWNCTWPLDWQRHYRVLAALAGDEPGGRLPDIAPGVMHEGDDLGTWITRQRRNWTELTKEQQQRLSKLGITPVPRPEPAATGTRGARNTEKKPSPSFQRGIVALAQYIAREGHHHVGRHHRERVVLEGQEHEHKLGVWYANQKQRRNSLTQQQRAALAELGVEWA